MISDSFAQCELNIGCLITSQLVNTHSIFNTNILNNNYNKLRWKGVVKDSILLLYW